MATKIVTKNSSTASAVPTASDLVQGELAVNVADKRLFTEDNAGAIVELGTNPSGNVTFQDNGKAIFGAGSDLQIYHDGDSSYISHNTTGTDLVVEATSPGDDVIVRAADDLNFRVNGNENGIVVAGGGATSLYHANSVKLSTTSTGIDVTGTVSADGLTVGDNEFFLAGAGGDFKIGHDGTDNIIRSQGPSLYIDANNHIFRGYSPYTEHMRIDSSGNLLVGKTAAGFANTGHELRGGGSYAAFTRDGGPPVLVNRKTSDGTLVEYMNDGSTVGQINARSSDLVVGTGDTGLQFYDFGDAIFPLSASGNTNRDGAIDLGESSNRFKDIHLAGTYHVNSGGTGKIQGTNDASYFPIIGSGTSGSASIYLNGATRSGFAGHLQLAGTNTVFFNETLSQERMRIDSAGRVGIGTSSPSAGLELNLASGDGLLINSADIATIKMKNTSGGVTNWGFATTNLAAGDFGIYASNSAGGDPITAGTPKLYFTSAGNVGIGTSSPVNNVNRKTLALQGAWGGQLDIMVGSTVHAQFGTDNFSSGQSCRIQSQDGVVFKTGGSTERMRIDSDGRALYGTTDTTLYSNTSGNGALINGGGGEMQIACNNSAPMWLNRMGNDGEIIKLYKAGATVGSIGVQGSRPYFGNSINFSIKCDDFGGGSLVPANQSGTPNDNLADIGTSVNRWDNIYATNGTIQTSDRNEKQDIEALSDAEQRVAVACKGLLRKFRWKDSVAEKGDEARTHFGIIAQDLQAAFVAEGLDAGDYAMFISTTWTDEETNEEKTRMGVRYSELLAFIIAAI